MVLDRANQPLPSIMSNKMEIGLVNASFSDYVTRAINTDRGDRMSM